MLLLLHITVTYIRENIITKLQKFYSLPRNPRTDNKLPMLSVKKPVCTGSLVILESTKSVVYHECACTDALEIINRRVHA